MGARAILAALPSVVKSNVETEMFKIYVSDCMKILTENTAKIAGGNVISKRFSEINIFEKPDNRTGEEIAAEIIKKAGLKVVIE